MVPLVAWRCTKSSHLPRAAHTRKARASVHEQWQCFDRYLTQADGCGQREDEQHAQQSRQPAPSFAEHGSHVACQPSALRLCRSSVRNCSKLRTVESPMSSHVRFRNKSSWSILSRGGCGRQRGVPSCCTTCHPPAARMASRAAWMAAVEAVNDIGLAVARAGSRRRRRRCRGKVNWPCLFRVRLPTL